MVLEMSNHRENNPSIKQNKQITYAHSNFNRCNGGLVTFLMVYVCNKSVGIWICICRSQILYFITPSTIVCGWKEISI